MMLFLVLYFIAFCGFVYVCGWAGYWILQPLGSAVRGQHRPTRFSMVDFFWLSILASAALAPLSNVVGSTRDRNMLIVNTVVAMVAMFVVLFVWWRGVATLSGLGIYDHRRRGVFLVIVLPAAIAVSLAGFPMILLFFSAAFHDSRTFFLWVGGIVSLLIIVISFRAVSFWILAGAGQTSDAGSIAELIPTNPLSTNPIAPKCETELANRGTTS